VEIRAKETRWETTVTRHNTEIRKINWSRQEDSFALSATTPAQP
jgi:hypothetical protein